MNRRKRGLETLVEENPIMTGVAGLAAGLIIGALLPGSRRENELVGSYADDVKGEGKRYAQELAKDGQAAVRETRGQLSGKSHPEVI